MAVYQKNVEKTQQHHKTNSSSVVDKMAHQLDYEEDELRSSYERGCYCNRRCSKLFDYTLFRDMVLMCGELTNEQLDMLITGELLACTDAETRRTDYMFRGIPVCRTTFCLVHDITDKRLDGIATHFKARGISPRKHKHNRKRGIIVPEETIYHFSEFLKGYAEVHAIGSRGTDHKLRELVLPPTLTKQKVYEEYMRDCLSLNREYMSEALFVNYWNELHQNIIHKSEPASPKEIVIKPMDSLNNNDSSIPTSVPPINRHGETTKTKLAHLKRVEYTKHKDTLNYPTMCLKEKSMPEGNTVIVVPPSANYEATRKANGSSYPFHYRNTMVSPGEMSNHSDSTIHHFDEEIVIVKTEEMMEPLHGDSDDGRSLLRYPEHAESKPKKKKLSNFRFFNGIITEVTEEMEAEVHRLLRDIDLEHAAGEVITEMKSSIGPRHKLALRLLRCIFTKEELSTDKIPKDDRKLIVVKELSFLRCREEEGELRDISWKDIVGRIYSRQRNLRNAKT